jgi:hypothetical protein
MTLDVTPEARGSDLSENCGGQDLFRGRGVACRFIGETKRAMGAPSSLNGFIFLIPGRFAELARNEGEFLTGAGVTGPTLSFFLR